MMNFLSSLCVDVVGVNEGLELSLDPNWHLSRWLEKNPCDVYLVEFHWYEHLAGALRISDLCKATWPRCAVAVGGLSASIMPDLVIGHCAADVVTRSPFFDDLANLQGLGWAREALSTFSRSYLDSGDFLTLDWLENDRAYLQTEMDGTRSPIEALWLPIARGCTHRCFHCGGNADMFHEMYGTSFILRDPEVLNRDVERLTLMGVRQARLSHDISIMPASWLERLHGHKELGIYNEFYQIPSRTDAAKLSAIFNIRHSQMELVPLSGHEETRREFSKYFTNEQLTGAVSMLIGCGYSVDVYFSPNIGHDVEEAFRYTLALADALKRRFPSGLTLTCRPLRVDPFTRLARQYGDYRERVLADACGVTTALTHGDAEKVMKMLEVWNSQHSVP